MNTKDKFFIEWVNDRHVYHNAFIYAFGKLDAIWSFKCMNPDCDILHCEKVFKPLIEVN